MEERRWGYRYIYTDVSEQEERHHLYVMLKRERVYTTDVHQVKSHVLGRRQ